jgi:hypothetical protein
MNVRLVISLLLLSGAMLADGSAHADPLNLPAGTIDFLKGFTPGANSSTITAASSLMLFGVREGRTDAGADIVQWYADSGSEQAWYFDTVGYDVTRSQPIYEIRNQKSGLCIWTDHNAGDPVVQMRCDPDNVWQWWERATPSGSTYPAADLLFNPAGGLVLDVAGDSYNAGAEIDVWYRNSGLNQQFYAAGIGSY